jgi:SAM-dependent methyltransferase
VKSADSPDGPRQLENSQLQAFDKEFISGAMWDRVIEFIERDFGNDPFSLLDIGGGNGVFVDALLDRFPRSEATLVDNSELLLSKNAPRARKTLVCESVTNLEARLKGRRFDIIFMNWLLHHLVLGSYRQTRDLQTRTLGEVARLLGPRGRIHILECIYEGVLIPNLPGWMIYQMTSSRLMAPVARKLGANTAGCGVCFLNHSTWMANFEKASLKTVRAEHHPDWKPSLIRRLGLQLRTVHDTQYWLSRP